MVASRFLVMICRDFSDTAALLDLMDMVITIDTSVAHLAGAVGKPVWILLPYNPNSRWLLIEMIAHGIRVQGCLDSGRSKTGQVSLIR